MTMSKEKAIRMVEGMDDCANIASSALVLAIERSMDLRIPSSVTLMMLKKLCDANIKSQMDQAVPEKLVKIADEIGININIMRDEAVIEMQTAVDMYFDLRTLELKRVEVS